MTKEQALDSIADVYEYCLTLGFNHPMSRDIQVWMQRHWTKAGTDRAQAIRRKVTTDNKEKKTPSEAVTEAQSKGLQTFEHPRQQSAGQTPKAPLKQMERPKSSRIEAPEEQEQKQAQPEAPAPPPAKKEKIAAVELTAEELQSVVEMKPRTILMQYQEPRISLTLKTVYGIEEEDMPNSGSQKAALLKQKVIEVGKK